MNQILVQMELRYDQEVYQGLKSETVHKLNHFLQTLPEGKEYDDDFHKLMLIRKQDALTEYNKYLKKRRKQIIHTHNVRIPEFAYSKTNLSRIKSNLIRVKIENFLKYNVNFNFPRGVFDKENPRCSNFNISGTPHNPIKNLSKYSEKLIKDGKIHINTEFGNHLSALTKEAESIFKNQNDMFSKSGNIYHEILLPYILQKNEKPIGIETFIWKQLNESEYINKFLTGHIDLLLVDKDTITIADYKPDEYNFLFSVPQVASYGLILKNSINIPNIKIKCITFNKQEAWEYNPEILLTDVREIVKELKIKHQTLNPVWEQYF